MRGGGGTAPTTTTGGAGSITIVVNRKEYEAPAPDMTPEGIKRMADAPSHHVLILVAGAPDGGDDEPSPDGSGPVLLERGMRFRTVNRAEFGRAAARGAGRPRPPRVSCTPHGRGGTTDGDAAKAAGAHRRPVGRGY